MAGGRDRFVAFALTEPNDESDVVRFETRARLDRRVPNGTKRSIGISPIADRLDLGAWR